MSAPITLDAALTCPRCECKVTGHWTGDRETADQHCGSCGHVFEATWPGFHFEPEVVIVRRPPGEGARQ